MLALLPNLRQEVAGVRAGADIEAVHRMRVASRRLRAALALYVGCAGRREYRRWRREVRSITRALGEARDADVQIEFLASYAAALPESDLGPAFGWPGYGQRSLTEGDTGDAATIAEPAPPGRATRFPRLNLALGRVRSAVGRRRPGRALSFAPPVPAAREGIDCLLLRLGQRRSALQPEVLGALDRLEESGVLDTMAGRLRERATRARISGVSARSAPSYEAAYLHAALHCDELGSHAPALRDPLQASEHHAMRIAAKRLRYTLETFALLYDDELKGELKALKRLQEALGQLHDCDVWIASLPGFLEEERARTIAYFGHDGFFLRVEPGVRQLLADRIAERERLHAAALAGWEELERDRFFERLLARLALARDEAMLPPAPLRALAEGTGPARIALIADVHGDLRALEAVVRDAEARGVGIFIGAGDLAADDGDPEGVLRRLADLGSVDVRGEAERRALRAAHRDQDPVSMDAASLASLEGLPPERRSTLRGRRFLVVHRYPRHGRDRIGPWTAAPELARFARTADADLVVVGHSHRPFVLTSGGTTFINPGSVGRAGGQRADYALLQLFPFDLSLL
jgi:putative phosphoesterase